MRDVRIDRLFDEADLTLNIEGYDPDNRAQRGELGQDLCQHLQGLGFTGLYLRGEGSFSLPRKSGQLALDHTWVRGVDDQWASYPRYQLHLEVTAVRQENGEWMAAVKLSCHIDEREHCANRSEGAQKKCDEILEKIRKYFVEHPFAQP